jgi:hypothetical protein
MQEIFLFRSVQTGSEGQATSSPVGKWVLSPGSKVESTAHLHLVARSRMMELYVHSPIWLHSVVFNEAQGYFYLFTFIIFEILTTRINTVIFWLITT